MILIDGFVLSKTNGMSYCLQSIMEAIPDALRRKFLVLVPSVRCCDRIPLGFNMRVINVKSFLLWENVVLPLYLCFVLRGIDSFFSPANTMPIIWLKRINKYLLLHDVMFAKGLSVSGFRQLINNIYYRMNLQVNIRSCVKVFTVSEFSKNDISALCSIVDANDVIVISEGVKKFPCPEVVPGLPSSFFLGVCLSDPRKNTKLCIEGFLNYISMSDNFVPLDVKLVLFGDVNVWEKIKDEYRDRPFFDSSVIFVGRVTDGELAYLYSKSDVFIFPSEYEGFGLPVLEAMHFGKPVVTTYLSSLPEVGGNAAVYIKELTALSIADALRYLSDELNYQKHSLLCLNRVKQFSWDNSAKLLLEGLGVSDV